MHVRAHLESYYLNAPFERPAGLVAEKVRAAASALLRRQSRPPQASLQLSAAEG